MVSKNKKDQNQQYEGIKQHAAWPKRSSLMYDKSDEMTRMNKNAAIIAVGFWIADLCKKVYVHRVV